jgi:hypothetical protein
MGLRVPIRQQRVERSLIVGRRDPESAGTVTRERAVPGRQRDTDASGGGDRERHGPASFGALPGAPAIVDRPRRHDA